MGNFIELLVFEVAQEPKRLAMLHSYRAIHSSNRSNMGKFPGKYYLFTWSYSIALYLSRFVRDSYPVHDHALSLRLST